MPTSTSPEAIIEISSTAALDSEPYIGKWNQLISTTNWEKGAIICSWRERLKSSEVPAAQYSDEAWCQLVGGVTAQHVGRLRRTSERFGHVFQEYAGIFWSHFYAALDWEDAEMWLEGAVQSNWSVSRMRRQRWEVLGKQPDQEPKDRDIVSSELKEENQSLELTDGKRRNDRDVIEGPVYEGPDFGDNDPLRTPGSDRGKSPSNNESFDEDQPESVHQAKSNVRPFESFVDLPEDVEEAISAFKVAIIHHRADQWSEIKQEDMLGLLEALKVLVTAE